MYRQITWLKILTLTCSFYNRLFQFEKTSCDARVELGCNGKGQFITSFYDFILIILSLTEIPHYNLSLTLNLFNQFSKDLDPFLEWHLCHLSKSRWWSLHEVSVWVVNEGLVNFDRNSFLFNNKAILCLLTKMKECTLVWGECGHSFHHHCIQLWITHSSGGKAC